MFALLLALLSIAQFSLAYGSVTVAGLHDSGVQMLQQFSIRECGDTTMHMINENGLVVNVTFSGIGISVVGSKNHGEAGGIANFILDGQRNGTEDFSDGRSNDATCYDILYESPVLSNGTHTLSVDFALDEQNSDSSYLAIQGFLITSPSPDPSPNTTATPAPSLNNNALNSNNVAIPKVVGVAIGSAAAGFTILLLGIILFPIIRRKILSRGAVTGQVQSGLYRVLNDKYLNVAAASDANDTSPVAGISYGRIPEHKWDVILQDNNKYLIRNHAHSKVYAGFRSPEPELGDDVVNNSSSVEWNIGETKAGSGKYRIFTTDTGGKPLYWSLSYDVRGTPITLLKSSESLNNDLWSLCLLEPLDPERK